MRTLTAFFQIALAGRSAGPALPPIDIFPRRLSGNFLVNGSRHRNGQSRKAKVRLWLSFLSMPDSGPRRRDSVTPPDHAKKHRLEKRLSQTVLFMIRFWCF